MKLDGLLNPDRVNALRADPHAYVAKTEKVTAQEVPKVIFPQPYENAAPYYSKDQFKSYEPPCNEPHAQKPKCNQPMFDIKSLLPMLMSGKMDMLKPLLSMLGGSNGGGLGDIGKIFELLRPKPKPTKAESQTETMPSKFDDMIIIED